MGQVSPCTQAGDYTVYIEAASSVWCYPTPGDRGLNAPEGAEKVFGYNNKLSPYYGQVVYTTGATSTGMCALHLGDRGQL